MSSDAARWASCSAAGPSPTTGRAHGFRVQPCVNACQALFCGPVQAQLRRRLCWMVRQRQDLRDTQRCTRPWAAPGAGMYLGKLALALQSIGQLQHGLQALVAQGVAAPGPHRADVQGMVQRSTELDRLLVVVLQQQAVGALQHLPSSLHTGRSAAAAPGQPKVAGCGKVVPEQLQVRVAACQRSASKTVVVSSGA